MSPSIDYQNIKIPFPPSISVDEIIQMHLKKGIKNANKTMNAFMIYRKEYNHIVANFNLSCKDVSKFAKNSWKNEPENVKDYYRQMAKNVKKCFKEKVPLCFIYSNQVYSTNDNRVDTSLLNTNQNFSPLNIDQNSLGTTCYNSSFPNMNTLVSDNFENSLNAYITMSDDILMNYLSEDLALTYRAIIQSLPF